jgi:hypothetical protein
MRYVASFQFETGALSHHEPLKLRLVDLIASQWVGIRDL